MGIAGLSRLSERGTGEGGRNGQRGPRDHCYDTRPLFGLEPMLRYGLAGGIRPTLPWEFFASLGGGLFLAGALYGLLFFPLWGGYSPFGWILLGCFFGAGSILVAAGMTRRNRATTSDTRSR